MGEPGNLSEGFDHVEPETSMCEALLGRNGGKTIAIELQEVLWLVGLGEFEDAWDWLSELISGVHQRISF